MVQDEASSSVTSSSPLQSFSLMSISPGSLGSPYAPWLRALKSDERGLYLIHLLLNCANHVSAGNLDHANTFLEHISLLASPDGDTMQRIAAYFTEALACRLIRSWPGVYRALNSTRTVSLAEFTAARRHFLDLFPFLRLAFVISNQAIIEAMEGEKIVHVVDLCASDPAQWLGLLQALGTRPEGPPHLRITGVHDQKDVLVHTAACLSEEAEKLDIPFQFNPVISKLENMNIESLRVKTGEALAISSALQLHCLLASDSDESPARRRAANSTISQLHRIANSPRGTLGELLEKDLVNNGYSPSPDSASSSPIGLAQNPKMDSFLSALWGLSPKIMVVTEQESNHNGGSLNERFMESLNFYAAMFDCLESTVSRNSVERMRAEKMVLGEEIKNIIACEGMERRERHEKLEKWRQRMDSAGFGRVPLSYFGLLQARRMLQSFCCEGYKVMEENGCFMLCWQDRPLFSVSAWRCRRFD